MNKKNYLIKVVICIFIFCFFLFQYISKSNELTELKLALPKLEKKLIEIVEENKKYQYQIDKFESPSHLLELARSPQFSHLKHPLIKNVLKVQDGEVLSKNNKGVEKTTLSVNNKRS